MCCVCVLMCTCLCVYVYSRAHAYVYYVFTCTCLYVCIFICTCLCVNMCSCAYVQVYVCSHACHGLCLDVKRHLVAVGFPVLRFTTVSLQLSLVLLIFLPSSCPLFFFQFCKINIPQHSAHAAHIQIGMQSSTAASAPPSGLVPKEEGLSFPVATNYFSDGVGSLGPFLMHARIFIHF